MRQHLRGDVVVDRVAGFEVADIHDPVEPVAAA